jgi:hypothetical protein
MRIDFTQNAANDFMGCIRQEVGVKLLVAVSPLT